MGIIFPVDVPIYETTDVVLGLNYLTSVQRRLNKPMVICVPVETIEEVMMAALFLRDLLTISQ